MYYRKGSHSIYNLRYHVIFCTKYRYRVLTGQIAERVREIIREVCAANYIDIISGSVSPDHMHMFSIDTTEYISIKSNSIYQRKKW